MKTVDDMGGPVAMEIVVRATVIIKEEGSGGNGQHAADKSQSAS